MLLQNPLQITNKSITQCLQNLIATFSQHVIAKYFAKPITKPITRPISKLLQNLLQSYYKTHTKVLQNLITK